MLGWVQDCCAVLSYPCKKLLSLWPTVKWKEGRMDANGRHLHLVLDEEIQRVDGRTRGGTCRRGEAGSDEQQLQRSVRPSVNLHCLTAAVIIIAASIGSTIKPCSKTAACVLRPSLGKTRRLFVLAFRCCLRLRLRRFLPELLDVRVFSHGYLGSRWISQQNAVGYASRCL